MSNFVFSLKMIYILRKSFKFSIQELVLMFNIINTPDVTILLLLFVKKIFYKTKTTL